MDGWVRVRVRSVLSDHGILGSNLIGKYALRRTCVHCAFRSADDFRNAMFSMMKVARVGDPYWTSSREASNRQCSV